MEYGIDGMLGKDKNFGKLRQKLSLCSMHSAPCS